MATVTARADKFKQPRGGFIKPSELDEFIIDDGTELHLEENVHPSIIGMAVDYLTRMAMGEDVNNAFEISIKGAYIAEELGINQATFIAFKLIKGIDGVNDKSIINACKLVTFDVWVRNPNAAMMASGCNAINPDGYTIENIKTMINRSLVFFKRYGPVIKTGFTFEPDNAKNEDYIKMIESNKGEFGGYTPTVNSGDGDYITEDTIWDFKVSKSKPTSKHTLQLLMYWIMGLHSKKEEFKKIKKIGIFNPRLNAIYTYRVSRIDEKIIETIEKDVLCYGK